MAEGQAAVLGNKPRITHAESNKLGRAFSKVCPNLNLHCRFALTAMQLEGIVLKKVLIAGTQKGITALPIHDAVAVEFDHQYRAKNAMEESWQSVTSEFYPLAKSSVKISFSS